MAETLPSSPHRERLSRAGKALSVDLERRGLPVITNHQLFWLIVQIYGPERRKGLYLKSDLPGPEDVTRLRRNLVASRILRPDRDYKTRAYTVTTVSDLPADEIVCIVDPLTHISFLSAMQRWGLTNRSPRKLHIVKPDRATAKQLLIKYAKENASSLRFEGQLPIGPNLNHPDRVRSRELHVVQFKAERSWVNMRGSNARIAGLDQTFLDMVAHPQYCGGMSHVTEVWKEHAATYLDMIVTLIDRVGNNISKSRAGYILEEIVGISLPTLDNWAQCVQQGGSRLLDPEKPFANNYSERWAISINDR